MYFCQNNWNSGQIQVGLNQVSTCQVFIWTRHAAPQNFDGLKEEEDHFSHFAFDGATTLYWTRMWATTTYLLLINNYYLLFWLYFGRRQIFDHFTLQGRKRDNWLLCNLTHDVIDSVSTAFFPQYQIFHFIPLLLLSAVAVCVCVKWTERQF
jgi:hypothetical protein